MLINNKINIYNKKNSKSQKMKIKKTYQNYQDQIMNKSQKDNHFINHKNQKSLTSHNNTQIKQGMVNSNIVSQNINNSRLISSNMNSTRKNLLESQKIDFATP